MALGKNEFKVCLIYNKLRTDKIEFIKSPGDFLEKSTSSDMPFIICGDLNINNIEDNVTINF